MSSFPDSLDEIGAASYSAESTYPFNDEDGYTTPPYSNFADPQERAHASVIFNNSGDGDFASNPAPPVYGLESKGDPVENGVFVEADGPILPPPSEMQGEGFALPQWRWQNAILLEQKEKREKEILSQIIEEANEYKAAFHEKRKVTCENTKTNNREKQKLFLANQEKFHKEADTNYWKAIAELIPNEVPAIEKKRGKRDPEKKPSIVVVRGPKPGKPTDLARMRQIVVKLKHTTPAAVTTAKDGKTSAAEPPKPATAVAATPEAVVAA